MENVISVNIKSFSYGENENLKNIKFNIKDGEFIVLTGNSGCGKSTLIRIITGLFPSFYEGKLDGEVEILGRDINEYKKGELSKILSIVFQNPKDQFFCTNVYDEIALGAENLGIKRDLIIEKIESISKLLKIEKLLDKSIFSLSGGERQRVAIASALIQDSKILFFDEPSSSLDYDSIESFKEILKELKSMGKTIILAEHRLYYLKNLFDRIVFMKGATINEIFTRENFNNNLAKELGLRTLEERNLKTERIFFEKGSVEFFNNIYVSVGKKSILENISFDLKKGEVLGILGKNGSGKTSLSRIITGLVGKNQDTSIGVREKERLKNSYLVQQDVDSQIFLDTVENELLSISSDKEEIKKLLKEINLWDKRTSHPQKLSGGQKQRLAVITAFLSNRRVIILDEPTSGLDYKNMEIMAKLINEYSKKISIVIITHDLEFLFKCCNSALTLDKNNYDRFVLFNNEEKIFEFIEQM